MWNICRITEDLYCFTVNAINCENPVATVHMKALNNLLTIQIEVCMSYLNKMVEYDELLVEIRYFARAMKQLREKEDCVMNIHCQGLSCFDSEGSFPTFQDSNGIILIDATFYEEIN